MNQDKARVQMEVRILWQRDWAPNEISEYLDMDIEEVLEAITVNSN